MAVQNVKKIHNVLKEHKDYLGVEVIDNRIRVFVSSTELKRELSACEEYVDIFVALRAKGPKRKR